MRKICQNPLHFKRGYILIRQLGNKTLSGSINKRCYSRGPLPWEKPTDCPSESKRKALRKVQTTVEEKHCPQDCEVLKRPKRNTYQWVIEDEGPCKPFGVKKVVEKTVCEIRRLRKCIKLFGPDCPECQNVSPDCSNLRKTYPMLESTQKGSLPGCAREIPETHKQVSKNKQDK